MSITLNKVSFNKKLGIKAEYQQTANNKSESIVSNSSTQRHPDMDDLISSLRIHVAAIQGIVPIKMVRDMASYTPKETKLYNEVVTTITIKSIRFMGDEDNRIFMIGASRELFKGRNVACNTPQIREEDTEYSESAHLASICDDIYEEALLYIEEGKCAQVQMDFEEENEEGVEVVGEGTYEEVD